MLAAEALMEDLPPGTQSCRVDVWPGVPCAPQCQQSPPTPQTVATTTSSSSGCWVQSARSSNDGSESEGRRGDASWEAVR
eukprot:7241415-Lingulodinium_polyedra.AAC.1